MKYFKYLLNIPNLRVDQICLWNRVAFVTEFLRFEGIVDIKYKHTVRDEEGPFWGELYL